LTGDVAQVVNPSIGLLDRAREGFSFPCWHRAAMPAQEQEEAEISFKLRNCATDVRLADPECRGCFRHAAMTQHGTKQVEVSRVHHALSAWKRSDWAFDGMTKAGCQYLCVNLVGKAWRKRPSHRSKTDMFNLLLPSALAIMAGVSIVVQQALNTNLRVALNSAAWAGFVSYAVGVICMALLALVLRDPIPAASVAVRLPWWAWSGGLYGAMFIGLAIFLVPQLGAATFIALLVTGQMLASVTFDHFGWMGLARRAVDLPRLVGIFLLIGGVVFIRR
jgi:transporter family-2 protein